MPADTPRDSAATNLIRVRIEFVIACPVIVDALPDIHGSMKKRAVEKVAEAVIEALPEAIRFGEREDEDASLHDSWTFTHGLGRGGK